MKQKQKGPENLRKGAALLIAVLASAALIGLIFAKYLYPGIREWSQTTAPVYYFTADLLGDTEMVNAAGSTSGVYAFGPESTEGIWHIYGGSEHRLVITLQNYYDDLRITQSALNYTVTMETKDPSGSTVHYAGSTVTIDPKSGMLAGGRKSYKDITVIIRSHDEEPYEDGTELTVTVKSLQPYEKALVLRFVLYKGAPKLSYRVIDNAKSPYAELKLLVGETGEETITPTLIWPESLSIDNANPYTFTVEEGEILQQEGMAERNMEISKALRSRESESIYFFKSDITGNYTCPLTVVVPEGEEKRYIIDLTTILPAEAAPETEPGA